MTFTKPIMERLDEMVGQPLTREDAEAIREHIRKVEKLALGVIERIMAAATGGRKAAA